MDADTAVRLLAYFVSFVTGGYGAGTWLGKALALAFGWDNRSYWADVGGTYGGLVGVGLFIGVAGAILSS